MTGMELMKLSLADLGDIETPDLSPTLAEGSFQPLGLGKRPRLSTRISTWEVKERTRRAMARNMKSIMDLHNACAGQTVLICGGGPSLVDEMGALLNLYNRGHKIICTNKTHDFLVRRNIKPWAVVLLDPMPHVAEYVKLAKARTRVLIAGQCHEDTFKAVAHADCYLWHADDSDPNATRDEDIVPGFLLRTEFPRRTWRVIPGGNTGGLRSIFVSQFLGFRRAHLFGFDSSKRGDKLYAYDKASPADADEGPATLRINGHEQEFLTNEHMARQTELFIDVLKEIEDWGRKGMWDGLRGITVHGDGMLPCMAAGFGLHADPKMNAKWARKA